MRVLVTRPEPGASKTARRLTAAGHQALILPLTEIRPVASGRELAVADFDVVAMTSANAVRSAFAELIDAIRDLPCFVVGEESAVAARKAGFHSVTVSTGGDADGLAADMIAQTKASDRVLYLCGRPRRPDFEALLAQAGRAVVAVETYEAGAVASSCGEALAAIGAGPVDAALVYSDASAAALLRLMRQDDAADALSGTALLCISKRVADAFSSVGNPVHVAARPNEDDLLALLAR